jgi:hypothetical protein
MSTCSGPACTAAVDAKSRQIRTAARSAVDQDSLGPTGVAAQSRALIDSINSYSIGLTDPTAGSTSAIPHLRPSSSTADRINESPATLPFLERPLQLFPDHRCHVRALAPELEVLGERACSIEIFDQELDDAGTIQVPGRSARGSIAPARAFEVSDAAVHRAGADGLDIRGSFDALWQIDHDVHRRRQSMVRRFNYIRNGLDAWLGLVCFVATMARARCRSQSLTWNVTAAREPGAVKPRRASTA